MAKIMEFIAKETSGKSYKTQRFCYDRLGIPSVDYDDDTDRIIKWQDFRTLTDWNFQKKKRIYHLLQVQQ